MADNLDWPWHWSGLWHNRKPLARYPIFRNSTIRDSWILKDLSMLYELSNFGEVWILIDVQHVKQFNHIHNYEKDHRQTASQIIETYSPNGSFWLCIEQSKSLFPPHLFLSNYLFLLHHHIRGTNSLEIHPPPTPLECTIQDIRWNS